MLTHLLIKLFGLSCLILYSQAFALSNPGLYFFNYVSSSNSCVGVVIQTTAGKKPPLYLKPGEEDMVSYATLNLKPDEPYWVEIDYYYEQSCGATKFFTWAEQCNAIVNPDGTAKGLDCNCATYGQSCQGIQVSSGNPFPTFGVKN